MLYATEFDTRLIPSKKRPNEASSKWKSSHLTLLSEQLWNIMDNDFSNSRPVDPRVFPHNCHVAQYPMPVPASCPHRQTTFLPQYTVPFYGPNPPYNYTPNPIPYVRYSDAPPPAVTTEWMNRDSHAPSAAETNFVNYPSNEAVQSSSQWPEEWHPCHQQIQELSMERPSILNHEDSVHLVMEDTSHLNCFRELTAWERPSFKTLPSEVTSENSESEYEFGVMTTLLPQGLLSPSDSEQSDISLVAIIPDIPESKSSEETVRLGRTNSDCNDSEATNSTAVVIEDSNVLSALPRHAVNEPRDCPTPKVVTNSQRGRMGKGGRHFDSKMAGRKQLLADTQALLTSFKQSQPRQDRSIPGKLGELEGAQSFELQQQQHPNAVHSTTYFSRKPGFRAEEGRQFRSAKPSFKMSIHTPTNVNEKKQMEYPAPSTRESTPPQSNKVPQKEQMSGARFATKFDTGKAHGSFAKKEASQREYLEEQLRRGTYECMVCVEKVRPHSQTWNCKTCFNIFHLICISKWSHSTFSGSESWRCPTCQEVYYGKPGQYICFCGKIYKPRNNPYVTPHSCGNVCGLRRFDAPDCTHSCPLRCHPGPCPQCEAFVERHCPCAKTSIKIQCFMTKDFVCDNTCGKFMKCGTHICKKKCHVGECEICDIEIIRVCGCSKSQKTVPCGIKLTSFCCQKNCGKRLQCGNHYCQSECHQGSCPPCSLLPLYLSRCCCGKTHLAHLSAEPRKSCVQPVPTCNKLCTRKFSCGPLDNPHMCEEKCHSGPCPPCTKSTLTKCLCGQNSTKISCADLNDAHRCQKRCNKKKSCFRHKCLNTCCVEERHKCNIVCNRLLGCGIHKCQQLCHVGKCLPCENTSFDDLYCRCGASVLMAPISCGTKRPECTRPCTRSHECPHPPLHCCHDLPECPPCCVLTEKWCHGKHELRKHVPCHQTVLSCGLPCKSPLPCGLHRCNMVCHKGNCLKESEKCMQPCQTPRPLCGHPCDSSCHVGPCPETPCKAMIKITCPCKHRSAHRLCSENMQEYQIQTSSFLATTMAELQMGHSVDLNDKLVGAKAWQRALQGLDCNAECKILERNQKMAMALQIQNPDLNQKLSPSFSEFMRTLAKKDSTFVNMVHTKLTELVTLAKQSKTKTRSHSFPVMNREKRQFVHEYAAHFGCESIAFDEEPKRNVVVTALKETSWLPSMSVLEVLQREKGQRKVPAPNNREI